MIDNEDEKSLEEKVAALPAVPKAFVEGYGEGTAGWKPESEEPKERWSRIQPPEGYLLNLGGSTNRVCVRCGSVVADFDAHDEWHDKIDPKE